MASNRYTAKFKAEAIKQVTERGYKASEVVRRPGMSEHSLYTWLREHGVSRETRKAQQDADLQKENLRLRAELRRVEEERDIKAAAYFTKG